jgi:hypothetical protein
MYDYMIFAAFERHYASAYPDGRQPLPDYGCRQISRCRHFDCRR